MIETLDCIQPGAEICRQVAVMYAGTVVEEAPTGELLARPLHPYARGLVAAVPDLDHPDRRPGRGACPLHPRSPWG